MSLVKIANKLPKLNGKFFGAYVLPPIPTYKITLFPSQNGSISADTLEGIEGTLVTLSNTPDTHYSFGGYGITGATLTGNQFLIWQDDISVQGTFIEDAKYSLSLTQTTGGSINANKNTGYAGDIITLSNTPSSHYSFNGYSITGATLTGNQFAFGSQNVTAKGTFVADPIRTVTLTQVAGGNIAANPTTGYDGTTVTLSNTANAGYTFNNYTLTGGILTGNKFVLNGGNATASLNLTHNVYNLTVQTDGHGKLTASKSTGYYNDTASLSTTASAGYSFNNYSVTGGTINGNTFTFGVSNATAKANFNHNVYTLTLQTNGNGKLVAGKTTGYYNDTTTLTATPSANYVFSGFSVTGGTITNSSFKFGKSNATAKAWFDVNYNPLNLPPYTVRLKYKNGVTPSLGHGTLTQVSQNPNVWDMTYNTSNWVYGVYLQPDLLEVMGGNTTNVTSMVNAFAGNPSLSSVALFDTRNVVTMANMFINDSALSSVPKFDTSNVVTMTHTFNGCSFTSVPLFDLSNVSSVAYSFMNCKNLVTVPQFNMPKVESTQGMFEYCKKLKTTPSFYTPKLKDTSYMYLYCNTLSSVSLFNTSGVKTTTLMFGNCPRLKTVPLFDTSNDNSMIGMFSGCTGLRTIPQFNTNKVVEITAMFSGCKSLSSVPLLNTQNVSSMGYAFAECSALRSIPLFNTSKVVGFEMSFMNCVNVSAGISALYNQISTQTKPPIYYGGAFENCGINTTQGAAELALIPSNWK